MILTTPHIVICLNLISLYFIFILGLPIKVSVACKGDHFDISVAITSLANDQNSSIHSNGSSNKDDIFDIVNIDRRSVCRLNDNLYMTTFVQSYVTQIEKLMLTGKPLDICCYSSSITVVSTLSYTCRSGR